MAGIYDILAGMGAPPAPYQPRPDRALQHEAASQARDVYGPLVMDAFEQEDRARFAALRQANNAGSALAAALAGIGPVGAPYGAGAGQIATNAEALGNRAYSEGTTVGADVAARLAAAGQDPGIGAALQDIGRRSQGVLNALGAAGVENLLSKEAAANSYGNAIAGIAQSGFQSQAARAAQTPDYTAARGIAGQEADAMQNSFLKARELEMEQAARSEEQQQQAREFIMRTAMQGLGDQPSPLDLARFEQDILENQQDEDYRAAGLGFRADQESYDRQQDAIAAQADAAEAAADAEADRRGARKDAMGNRDQTFSRLESAATSIAARLAKGRKVRVPKLDIEGGETGEYETVTKPYAWAEAMRLAMQEIMAKYQTDIRRSALKGPRILEIVRQALIAAQFEPPRPQRPSGRPLP